MGLVRVRKPEGLVSREVRSKARLENVIQISIQIGMAHKCNQIGATHKCNQQVRLTSAIDRCDSQVRSTGATHKCDRQVRLTSAIDRCDSQVRLTGATHKTAIDRCDSQVRLIEL